MQPENTQQRADNSLARQNTHPHGKQINRPKFERGRNNRQPENHPASRAPAKNAKAVASRASTPNRPGFAKVSTDKRQPEKQIHTFSGCLLSASQAQQATKHCQHTNNHASLQSEHVSTHSLLKAAGKVMLAKRPVTQVSTHNRPKAAAPRATTPQSNALQFNPLWQRAPAAPYPAHRANIFRLPHRLPETAKAA